MMKRGVDHLTVVEDDIPDEKPQLDVLQTFVIQSEDGEEVAQIIQQEDGCQLTATAITDADDGDGTLTIAPEEVVEDQLQLVTDDDQNPVIIETVESMPLSSDEQLDEIDGLQAPPQYQNIIIQHMDIEEPLTTLRTLLEQRLQCSLNNHEFYLQDAIRLDPRKNLVSQCVQGTGMVQVNVEVKSQPDQKPRLNIVDILKPADEVDMETVQQVQEKPEPSPTFANIPTPTTKVVIPLPEESENVTRWIVDQSFRKEQERLKIPLDPYIWNQVHVKFWLNWAIKEFGLNDVDEDGFVMSGRQLCDLKHADFVKLIPNDPQDVFWTHLELLRRCKFVAVVQQPTPHAITTITVSTSSTGSQKSTFGRKMRQFAMTERTSSPGNRTGNNGQIQLWQFLLELLTDKDYRDIIHWVGDEGEFKLNNPEMVAQLWGRRKNKPTMNYEKLSRALRYYYDGDMIAKVHGKRFVYKFVCDLKMLLGYTAAELNRLVFESAEKKIQEERDSIGLRTTSSYFKAL